MALYFSTIVNESFVMYTSKIQLKNPLLSLLQKCRKLPQIIQVHAQLIATGLISDTFAVSRLIIAVTSCNASSNMEYAELVFLQIQKPHTFIWNSMMRGYIDSSKPQIGFEFFRRMRKEGVDSDCYTYSFVLKACGLMLGLKEGNEVHGEVVKSGFELDVYVVNGLISMYCRCGRTACGRILFDGFEGKDLISWNTMVGGYIGCEEMNEAQKLFGEMPERDLVSWTMMIDAYGKKFNCVARARELFNKMPNRDMVAWNSMISSYTHAGDMVLAGELFREMPEKNVISWSIMIDGYVRHGNPREGLNLFHEMLSQGIRADRVSVVGAIQACGQIGALDQGKWIHVYMEKNDVIADIVVQTALLDMYMKCGALNVARRLFKSMSHKSIVSWNVMIVGLGINGDGNEALKLFAQMVEHGVPMDELTLLGVLSACNHSGLVNEGLLVFTTMKKSYGVEPKVEHYSCIVDLLSRAGRIGEAKNVIETIKPVKLKDEPFLWSSLLGACRANGNVTIAEVSLQRLVELKEDDAVAYVQMSNIYADKGMWRDVSRIRRLMSDRGMEKEIARSSIEVDGDVHEFGNGDGVQISFQELESVIWGLSRVM